VNSVANVTTSINLHVHAGSAPLLVQSDLVHTACAKLPMAPLLEGQRHCHPRTAGPEDLLGRCVSSNILAACLLLLVFSTAVNSLPFYYC